METGINKIEGKTMTNHQRSDSLESVIGPIREQLKMVVVGHVDHGKSTLIGRLFYDTGSLPEGRYQQIRAQCQRRGMPFEWAFLMDSLQAERDQGITIDTTQICLRTAKRDYMIIDAPGHKEFLKNMVSGAASSDSALLVIDARQGVGEQSKRHGYLLHLLGVDRVAVAINKMDLEDYSQKKFDQVKGEYLAYLSGIGVTPTHTIPISAMQGDCILGGFRKHALVSRTQHYRSHGGIPAQAKPLRLTSAVTGPGRVQVRRKAHHCRTDRIRHIARG
jgi:small GTP-binding protein